MADVVVTIPQAFGLAAWIAEGDLPGEAWSGIESHFYLGGSRPKIEPGERVYVVCGGRLRGFAPLIRLDRSGRGWTLVRHNDAQAITITAPIRGFRYRWWERQIEISFLDWQQA